MVSVDPYYCRDNFETVGYSNVFNSNQEELQGSRRKFFLIDSAEINREDSNAELKTIKGTMSIHCAMPSTGNHHSIVTRQLSCACTYCIHGAGICCANTEVGGQWSETRLVPSTPERTLTPVIDSSVDDGSSSAQETTHPTVTDSSVKNGSFVMIHPAEQGYDYYILQCKSNYVFLVLDLFTNNSIR